MSSVLDDKRKKVTNQPATTTTTEQPTDNSQGGEYVKWKGVWYKKLDFDKIPKSHTAARAAGYVLYKKPNGQITWANQTEDINDLGAFINGAWYEKVDNDIAKAAGRTFGVPQPTAAVTEQPATTTVAEQPVKEEVTEQPATKAVATATAEEAADAEASKEAKEDTSAQTPAATPTAASEKNKNELKDLQIPWPFQTNGVESSKSREVADMILRNAGRLPFGSDVQRAANSSSGSSIEPFDPNKESYHQYMVRTYQERDKREKEASKRRVTAKRAALAAAKFVRNTNSNAQKAAPVNDTTGETKAVETATPVTAATKEGAPAKQPTATTAQPAKEEVTGLHDAINNSPKEEKKKALLKDIKGKSTLGVRTEFNPIYEPYTGTGKKVLDAAIERGDLYYIDPTNMTYPEQSTNRQNVTGWNEKMANNREAYNDKEFAKLAAYPVDTIYGVKVAEDDRRLPESVAYLDGTMPRKVAKPITEQTAVVPTAAPAAKPETTEQRPAATAQPTTTTAEQSRYDKAIAYINEASKSPSRRERRDIRKMEKAAKKLIEDGKIRIETEPIAFERDLEEVEIIADKNPTQQTPAKETSTPAEQAPAAQAPAAQPAVTTQQETAKDEVPAQPASTAQQTASEETPEQMTYTELLKRFYPVMTPEEKAEQQRRQRNRQIINAVGDGISALANLYYTNKSGVNAYDPSTSLTKAAKERYDKLLAQQREDENRYKELAYRSGVADLEAAYKRERDAKADKRYEEQKETDAATAKQTQENWEKLFNYNKEKDEREFNQKVAKAAADNATRLYIATLNAKVKQDYNNNLAKYKGEQATVKTLGKVLPFPTDGEPLVIYENVWNTSAPEVMAILEEDGFETPFAWYTHQPTSTQIADWVKAHWRKSPRATALMRALAQITPATLPVQAADDGVIDYVPGGADEEIIDYVPNN